MTGKPSFFAELQRRNVYKVGAMYCVAGWLLVQVVTQVFPIYDISAHAQRIIVGLIIAGFPAALVLAWLFDITPQGIVRTADLSTGSEAPATVALVLAWLFDITPQGIVRTADLSTGSEAPATVERRRTMDRKLNYLLGALLLVGAAYWFADREGVFSRAGGAGEASSRRAGSTRRTPLVSEHRETNRRVSRHC